MSRSHPLRFARMLLVAAMVPACAPDDAASTMSTGDTDDEPLAGGDADIEVRVVEHSRSCGEACGTWIFDSVLAVQLRSDAAATVEVAWTGTDIEGRPAWETQGEPMQVAELAPDTWTEVTLREGVLMCGPTGDAELAATFRLEIDGEPVQVDGVHVETVVEPDCG